uniref:Uncharacterized protein n=1 Tax=Vitis vinifera TaxID=29760 RepID=F6HRW9_VITVI
MGNRVGGMGNRVADLHSLTKFQEILRCSVCFDFMQSPIYQNFRERKVGIRFQG